MTALTSGRAAALVSLFVLACATAAPQAHAAPDPSRSRTMADATAPTLGHPISLLEEVWQSIRFLALAPPPPPPRPPVQRSPGGPIIEGPTIDPHGVPRP
ncbi:MAG: hypothetical protein M3O15_00145 [Acidobacteriota bacterium]|nr:hypothetical protein [Acidobacteriota bacterium]